jgi:hypothetical protein
VLIGGVVAGIYVDSRMRGNPLEELLTAVEKTDVVIDEYTSDDRFSQFADDLRKAQGLQHQADAFQKGAWATFSESNVSTSNEYVTPVQRAMLDVEAVNPLPWHFDLAEAQEAYRVHANA